jgi:hypothetical protein
MKGDEHQSVNRSLWRSCRAYTNECRSCMGCEFCCLDGKQGVYDVVQGWVVFSWGEWCQIVGLNVVQWTLHVVIASFTCKSGWSLPLWGWCCCIATVFVMITGMKIVQVVISSLGYVVVYSWGVCHCGLGWNMEQQVFKGHQMLSTQMRAIERQLVSK